jgi:hypothetical protein
MKNAEISSWPRCWYTSRTSCASTLPSWFRSNEMKSFLCYSSAVLMLGSAEKDTTRVAAISRSLNIIFNKYYNEGGNQTGRGRDRWGQQPYLLLLRSIRGGIVPDVEEKGHSGSGKVKGIHLGEDKDAWYGRGPQLSNIVGA